jgi:hypothetical protein
VQQWFAIRHGGPVTGVVAAESRFPLCFSPSYERRNPTVRTYDPIPLHSRGPGRGSPGDTSGATVVRSIRNAFAADRDCHREWVGAAHLPFPGLVTCESTAPATTGFRPTTLCRALQTVAQRAEAEFFAAQVMAVRTRARPLGWS